MKKESKKRLAFLLAFAMVISLIAPVNLQVKAAGSDTAAFAVELGDIDIQDGTHFKYSNADITAKNADDKVTSLTVIVDKGYIEIGSANFTDSKANHQIATWVWKSGVAVGTVENVLKNITFNYEKGMQVKVIVDGNDMTLPSDGKITSYVPQGSAEIDGNTHFYMYVPYSGAKEEWQKAYADAKGYYFMGMRGYLVTITEKGEDDILDNISNAGAWAGGAKVPKTLESFDTNTFETNLKSLENANSVWKWVCGPEADTKINISESVAESKGIDGATTGYAHWRRTNDGIDDEPNNYDGAEYWLQVHFPDTTNGWNDLNDSTMNDSADGKDYVSGYFVEFSEYDNGFHENYDGNKKVTVVNEPGHKHDITVTPAPGTNNGTITVSCTEDFDDTDCEINGHPLQVKVDAKTATYTGEPYAGATVTGKQDVLDFLEDYPDAGDEWTIKITYAGRDAATKYDESETAPTDVGKYNAIVTLTAPDGTKYVSRKGFDINPAKITVKANDITVAQNGTVPSSPQNVSVTDGSLKGNDKITEVALTGNTSALTDSGTVSVDKSSIVIKNGDKVVTGNYNIKVVNGKLKVAEAVHDWTATPDASDPSILDVYCEADPTSDPACTNAGPENAAKVEVNAPNATYTGKPYPGATLKDDDNVLDEINSSLPADEQWTVATTYEGRDGTTYPESATKPVDAGKYNAIITITNPADPNGTYVIKKPFEIAKKDVTITPNDLEVGKGSVIPSTPSDVTSAGLLTGDTITAVTIKGDTSKVTENGKVTVDKNSVVIKHGTEDVTKNYNITTVDGSLKVHPANHDWEAKKDPVDQTVIDIYCTNGDPTDDPGCMNVGPENAIKVETKAPKAAYTGKPYEGVVVDDKGAIDAINADLPADKQWTVTKTYEGRDGTTYPESSTAPVDAGKYNAIITLKDSDGNTTQIKKPFEITKKDIVVTPKEQYVTKGNTVATGADYVEAEGLAEGDAITAANITGDTSTITTNGALVVDPTSVVIKNGNKDVTKNYNVQAENGKLVVPADHQWKVETDPNKPGVVDVYCENGDPSTDPGCDYAGPEKAGTIELGAPDATYNGEPYPGAEIKPGSILDDINENLQPEKKWTVSEPTYEGRDGTDYPESATAPTDAGKYNAIVTITDSDGNKNKIVTPFEIKKQIVTAEPKTQTVGLGGAVSSTPADVTVTGLGKDDVVASATIKGDTSKITDNGKIEITQLVIKKGDKDVTDNYEIFVKEGVLKVVPADHKWKVDPVENQPGAVNIYCDNDDKSNDPVCPNPGKENASQLAVTAPDAEYTGMPYMDADVKGDDILDKINAPLPEDKKWTISNKTYEGREGTTYPETDVPPVDAGKYNAIVKVKDSDGNEYILKTPFEIAKRKLTITPVDQNVANGGSVSSTPKDVTASGLIPSDAITAITIAPNATNDKLIAKDVAIKNGDKDVTANYDVTYGEGKLTGEQDNKPVVPSTIEFVKPGADKQLDVPEADKGSSLTWTTSDPKVATVDPNGKVTAVDNGTATITAVDDKGNVKAQYNVVVKIPENERIIPKPSEKEVYENETAMNAGLKVMQTKKQINVKWGKVPGANRYEIFVQYCGKNYKKKPSKVVDNAVTTSVKITKINGKKLNLKKNYKIYIVAYKVSGSQKVRLGESIRAHIVGVKNTTQTNVKAVKVKKSKFTINKGNTAQIKAWTVLVDKTKHQLSNAHAKALRYRSDNEKVATVSAKGKIKAVGTGTCTVYVYARNGYAKKVKVTVK